MELLKRPLRPLLRLLFRDDPWRYEKDIELGRFFPSGVVSGSGVAVTEDTAMRASTVYACVRILAEDVSSTPLNLYQRGANDARSVAHDHPLNSILRDLPNEDMTAKEFWELMMWYKLMRGNAYARIQFAGNGSIRALYPLEPDRVRIVQPPPESRQKPGFEYTEGNGEKKIYRWEEIFKTSGPFGLSVISFARETIGMQLAQQQYAGSFFANYAAPRGVVQFKDSLGEDDDAIKRWKKHFVDTYSQPGNQWGVAVLENGAEFKPISMTHQDAEFVEARKMSREDIGGIFRVPAHKFGDNTHSTFSNVEELGVQYLNESLLSHFVGISQCIYRDLLTPEERQIFYAEHNTDMFNRGNTEQRYSAYASGRQHGFLSANDIRRKENLNPIEGGDVYLVQPGYIPADMLQDYVLQQMAGMGGEASIRAALAANPEATGQRIEVNVLNEGNKKAISKVVSVSRDENGHLRAHMTESPVEEVAEEKPAKEANGHANVHRYHSVL